MKTILLASLIFKISLFSGLWVKHKSNVYAKESIVNSLVRLVVETENGAIKGSGVLINVFNSNYVLTNAHVCLGPELEAAIDKTIKNPSISYMIDSKQVIQFADYRHSELRYNLEEDWCLIPFYSKVDFPVLTGEMISDVFSKNASTITYNRTEKTNKFDKFVGCATEHFYNLMAKESACLKAPELKGEVALTFSSSVGIGRAMRLKEHYTYQFPTIGGDSGSPVFNSQNKLVGLVSGQYSNRNVVFYGFVSPIKSFKKLVQPSTKI